MNVGRNIARDAAMTHFLLASDIELYPNPGLVRKFLEMIARNDAPLQRKYPRWVLVKYSLMTCIHEQHLCYDYLPLGYFHCQYLKLTVRWRCLVTKLNSKSSSGAIKPFHFISVCVLAAMVFPNRKNGWLRMRPMVSKRHFSTFFIINFSFLIRPRHILHWKANWIFCSLGANLYRNAHWPALWWTIKLGGEVW